MSASDLRSRVLAVLDRAAVPVSVPEWGDGFSIRPLSAGERLDFADSFDKLTTAERLARLVSLSLCDDSGTLVLAREDELALLTKSFPAIQRISAAVRKLNKFDAGDDEKKDS